MYICKSIYKSTRCHIPEDHNLDGHRHVNRVSEVILYEVKVDWTSLVVSEWAILKATYYEPGDLERYSYQQIFCFIPEFKGVVIGQLV